MSSFAQQLRSRHDDLFEAFYAHPFLRSLADGTAGRESVLHYVGQDNQYLTAYMRCYGAGIAMSPDREWVTWFRDSINFLLEDEVHPHHVMCEAFGVDYEDAQVDRLQPPAQAYIDHMMRAAGDTLGVLIAALLPCPWTYIWAAQRQEAEAPVADDNPFRGWWEFYAGDSSTAMLDDYIARFDALAEQASPAERERMARAFEDSCHHEIRFWQMAWTQETWESQLASRLPA
ncbi:thiaminase II [Brevibacterium daeguense]|uniref:Aminopyrimidine aminohydrolase n=1 Tax=Brevibacterium daeguense TaxID=909936 RepID=A0ABP8EFF5_9MICO|nr:thiaminase II [Brevibacterium daeguense]